MSEDQERERIRRIRDRQIQARDPTLRDKRFQHKVKGRKKKKLTFADVLADIPTKVWGMIIGGLVGIILAILLNVAVNASWTQWIGLIIVLACIVMGRGLGATISWKEEDHEELVKRW